MNTTTENPYAARMASKRAVLAIAARERMAPKARRRRGRPAGPALCGAVNPDHPHITCAAQMKDDDNGKPKRQHLGKHRARLVRGVLLRWEA